MKTHRLFRGPFTLACLLLSAASLFGQATSGNLVGTVLDASGAAVPGATVEARNRVTNVKSTSTANSRGEYRLSNLLIGRYDVTASASGFTPATAGDIAIQLNATETV